MQNNILKAKKRCIETLDWKVKWKAFFRKGRSWLSEGSNAPRNGTSWVRTTFIRDGFRSLSNI